MLWAKYKTQINRIKLGQLQADPDDDEEDATGEKSKNVEQVQPESFCGARHLAFWTLYLLKVRFLALLWAETKIL